MFKIQFHITVFSNFDAFSVLVLPVRDKSLVHDELQGDKSHVNSINKLSEIQKKWQRRILKIFWSLAIYVWCFDNIWKWSSGMKLGSDRNQKDFHQSRGTSSSSSRKMRRRRSGILWTSFYRHEFCINLDDEMTWWLLSVFLPAQYSSHFHKLLIRQISIGVHMGPTYIHFFPSWNMFIYWLGWWWGRWRFIINKMQKLNEILIFVVISEIWLIPTAGYTEMT